VLVEFYWGLIVESMKIRLGIICVTPAINEGFAEISESKKN